MDAADTAAPGTGRTSGTTLAGGGGMLPAAWEAPMLVGAAPPGSASPGQEYQFDQFAVNRANRSFEDEATRSENQGLFRHRQKVVGGLPEELETDDTANQSLAGLSS